MNLNLCIRMVMQMVSQTGPCHCPCMMPVDITLPIAKRRTQPNQVLAGLFFILFLLASCFLHPLLSLANPQPFYTHVCNIGGKRRYSN